MSTSTRTRSITRRIGALAGAAVVVAGLGLAAPAAHADDTPTPPTTAPAGGATRDRLEKACARIPDIETRVADRIARLQGDATTKGSLAWLQAQIDKASAKNRTQLVTVLQNRLELRTQLLDLLIQRQANVAEAKQICIDKGVVG